jgi:CelD/BcsL family acetyltransferase involved in cellulose biosynthesis
MGFGQHAKRSSTSQERLNYEVRFMNSDSNNVTMIESESSMCRRNNTTEVQIFLYNSFEETLPLQKEWDTFMEEIGSDIFMSFDWCRVWWKYYGEGRDLAIFILKRKEQIVGIMPMFRETIWLGPFRLNIMKLLSTDFSIATITLPIKQHLLKEIIINILLYINKEFNVDIIQLGPLSSRNSLADNIIATCEKDIKKYWDIYLQETGVQTYFKIEKSWDEQVAQLSYEQRRAIRRKYERLLKQGQSIECVQAKADNVGILFDNFVEMHQSHWQRKQMPGHFGAWPKAQEFHKEMASVQLGLDRLRLYQIRVNGNIIGYNYGYKFGDTYYYILFGRREFEKEDKIDFVRVDFGEMVKRAINEDVRWFDTMRGRYEYKLHLGGVLLPIKNLYIRSNRLISKITVSGSRMVARGIDVGYSKIWRSRIAPRMGIKAGYFWRTWLKSQDL